MPDNELGIPGLKIKDNPELDQEIQAVRDDLKLKEQELRLQKDNYKHTLLAEIKREIMNGEIVRITDEHRELGIATEIRALQLQGDFYAILMKNQMED